MAEQRDLLHALPGEEFHFLHDVRDGPPALFAARVRHDAERAAHVAALHDGDEGGGVARLGHVVADRVLGIRFLRDVADGTPAQRKRRIVHPRLHAAFQDAVHVFENLVVFLRADDEIEVRDALEKLLPAGLRHAAHEAIDHVRALLPLRTHDAHFPERLLLRLVAHRAGIDQDRVGVLFRRRQGVAALGEHPRHLLGVALVHLAAAGLEINFRHQRGNKITPA